MMRYTPRTYLGIRKKTEIGLNEPAFGKIWLKGFSEALTGLFCLSCKYIVFF